MLCLLFYNWQALQQKKAMSKFPEVKNIEVMTNGSRPHMFCLALHITLVIVEPVL